jgi:hypothetical protein
MPIWPVESTAEMVLSSAPLGQAHSLLPTGADGEGSQHFDRDPLALIEGRGAYAPRQLLPPPRGVPCYG